MGILHKSLALVLSCMVLLMFSGCMEQSPQLPEEESPTAQIDVSSSSVAINEPITFSAKDSTDPDGSIVLYEWNFGDGTTASGETVTHVYAKGGPYTITLTVVDSDGLSGTAETHITVMIGVTIKLKVTSSSTWREGKEPYNIYEAVKKRLEGVGFEISDEDYDATLTVEYKEEKGGYYSSIDAYGTTIACELRLYNGKGTLFEERVHGGTPWFFTTYGEPSEFTLYSKALERLTQDSLYFKYLGPLIATTYGVGDEISVMMVALRDGDVNVEAAGVLGDMGASVVEPLIQALKDEESTVRFLAAGALGDIGDRRAVDPLISALDDENPYVREYAAEALGEIGDTRAVEPLMKTLNDENEEVREAAREALDKIQSE